MDLIYAGTPRVPSPTLTPPPNPAGASVAPSPTQTDEPTLCLTAALLSGTGNHTTDPTGRIRCVGLNLIK